MSRKHQELYSLSTPKSSARQQKRQKSSALEWDFGVDEADLGLYNASYAEPEQGLGGDAHVGSAASEARRRYPEVTRQPATPLAGLLHGDIGARRVMATRMALDEALERWWTISEVAPLALLRDGLLLLEAGHTLDETQRSFLLRTALRRGRGVITALRHQHDVDRTAFLLKEALLDIRYPLPPQLLTQLQQEDLHSEEWTDYLLHDLDYELTVSRGKRRELAAAALRQLQQPTSVQLAGGWDSNVFGPVEDWLPFSHRWTVRWLLWAFLVLSLVAGYSWQHQIPFTPTVWIPSSSYTISDSIAAGRMRTVTLEGYRIDRLEVTNAAYGRCVEQGGCLAPVSLASSTRSDYFTNPAYGAYPVVNVDWDGAAVYCAWLGKRLPTLEEWEVAAAVAPRTQQYFEYPWGDRFDSQLANSLATPTNDTRVGGYYSPLADSPLGTADMAGNVAEWTATPAVGMIDGFVVKGGSYQDEPAELRNDVQNSLPRTTQAPWLGFRCAAG
ncbi:MAG: SUMF1/EgtB/PvdO family nonheme iron enzyme [Caldilineaceae bacterium]